MIAEPRIDLPSQALVEYCRPHQIRHMGLFGSVLRDDFDSDSDVDILVEFEPGARVSLFTLSEIQDELSAMLGRPVNLVPRDGLKPVIRESVLAAEYVLYAA